MTADTRLKICGAMIALSAAYGVLAASNPCLATVVAVGYCAVVLTAIVLVHVWRKP